MSDIIIFGKGWYFGTKQKEIEKNYNIIAFLDNAANNDGEESKIPVYLPNEVKNLPEVPILIMSIHFIEMYRQLISEGVHESRIKFGMNYAPFFDYSEKILNELNGKIIPYNENLMISSSRGMFYFTNIEEYRKIMNDLVRKELKIENILQLPLEPYSRRFGRERGTPVDRYYIERFIEFNKEKICGSVMEIGDDTYISKYGTNVEKSYVLHAMGLGENAIKGDLVTGEGIRDDFLDCFICTQTIQVIYDIRRTLENIYRSLKNNGTVLLTMHGISQLSISDYNRWGEYWRFTKKSATLLFKEYFDEVEVYSYGNVKTATALLYGLCMEDLSEEDYMVNDEYYPVIITVIGKKHNQISREED